MAWCDAKPSSWWLLAGWQALHDYTAPPRGHVAIPQKALVPSHPPSRRGRNTAGGGRLNVRDERRKADDPGTPPYGGARTSDVQEVPKDDRLYETKEK